MTDYNNQKESIFTQDPTLKSLVEGDSSAATLEFYLQSHFIDKYSYKGNPLWHHAVISKTDPLDKLKLLHKYGEDFSIQNTYGDSLFSFALKVENKTCPKEPDQGYEQFNISWSVELYDTIDYYSPKNQIEYADISTTYLRHIHSVVNPLVSCALTQKDQTFLEFALNDLNQNPNQLVNHVGTQQPAWHVILRQKNSLSLEKIILLHKYGADFNIPNSIGSSFYEYASSQELYSIKLLFVEEAKKVNLLTSEQIEKINEEIKTNEFMSDLYFHNHDGQPYHDPRTINYKQHMLGRNFNDEDTQNEF